MLPTASSLEGKHVPLVTFKSRVNDQWKDLTTDEIFKGKNVVLFALPGAFTPTCSSTHLPRYDELASQFSGNGVDQVVCMSVNDAFVMGAWQTSQAVEHVLMVPDGNGEFAAGMGMLVDKSNLGFGKRSWRYSMYVKSGVIAKMFIEPDTGGDPFTVSDADTMLSYINPNAIGRQPVVIFTKPGCTHCARAMALLSAHGYRYDEITLGGAVTTSTLRAVSGSSTWPQVFIGGKHIGDANELELFLAERKAA